MKLKLKFDKENLFQSKYYVFSPRGWISNQNMKLQGEFLYFLNNRIGLYVACTNVVGVIQGEHFAGKLFLPK